MAAIPSSFRFRLAQPCDQEFLLRLFRESQQGLIAALGSEAEPLIRVQFRSRQQSYAARYPDAEDAILADDAGRPVGRLLVARNAERWRIVDLAVLAEHRGQGCGTRALRMCQEQCKKAGARLELSVRAGNPAQRLYERLGFRVAAHDGVSMEMVWKQFEGGASRVESERASNDESAKGRSHASL